MESNKTYNWVPLETAVSMYALVHGEDEIPLFEGLELAWACMRNHIREFNTCNFYADLTPDEEGRVNLHTTAFQVDYVVRQSAGHALSSGMITSGVSFPKVEGVEYPGGIGEAVYVGIEEPVVSPSAAEYVAFEFKGDHLFVAEKVPVRVVYRVLELDPEFGFPLVTDKAAEACAAYIHKVETAKKYYRKEVDINMKRESERDFHAAAAEARRGDGFSANAMDAILGVMSSFGRKRHDLPFHVRQARP